MAEAAGTPEASEASESPEAPGAPPRRRTGFGSTVVLGLAAGTVAAVAGNQAWVSVSDDGSGDAAFAANLAGGADLTAPAVTAVALVALATWGVVLVSRGRPRRAVAVLGLVASLAVLALAVASWLARPGEVGEELRTLDLQVSRTVWSHLGVLAGVLGVVASLRAVLRVPTWPEMGRRYDAPATAAGAAGATVAAGVPVDEQSSIDLWKALDEGHDPTADPDD